MKDAMHGSARSGAGCKRTSTQASLALLPRNRCVGYHRNQGNRKLVRLANLKKTSTQKGHRVRQSAVASQVPGYLPLGHKKRRLESFYHVQHGIEGTGS